MVDDTGCASTPLRTVDWQRWLVSQRHSSKVGNLGKGRPELYRQEGQVGGGYCPLLGTDNDANLAPLYHWSGEGSVEAGYAMSEKSRDS